MHEGARITLPLQQVAQQFCISYVSLALTLTHCKRSLSRGTYPERVAIAGVNEAHHERFAGSFSTALALRDLEKGLRGHGKALPFEKSFGSPFQKLLKCTRGTLQKP